MTKTINTNLCDIGFTNVTTVAHTGVFFCSSWVVETEIGSIKKD